MPTPGDPNHPEVNESDQERAATALREAFARLQPQGSDVWNFLGAFTQMGDQFGPYHPGASVLSDLLEDSGRSPARRSGRMARFRHGSGGATTESGKTEVEEAMAQVVEAFRFLSARVATLEARLAHQDHPVDGASWLVPAQELGGWVTPIAAHLVARSPGGGILHGDCGQGDLLCALAQAGVTAHGVEPRGAVALRALERGCAVTISEVLDHVAALPSDSIDGLVLSGVVDRLPLHALLPMLSQVRRILRLDAPVVVVVTDPAQVNGQWDPAARDLLEGRPLHRQTWEILLDRAGFVDPAPLGVDGVSDGRFAVAASTPT
jgi:hypothetical protein